MGDAAKVCPDCATEATAVRGRRRGGPRLWWCWRCEKHIRPIAPLVDPADPAPNQDAETPEPGLAEPTAESEAARLQALAGAQPDLMAALKASLDASTQRHARKG